MSSDFTNNAKSLLFLGGLGKGAVHKVSNFAVKSYNVLSIESIEKAFSENFPIRKKVRSASSTSNSEAGLKTSPSCITIKRFLGQDNALYSLLNKRHAATDLS